MEIHPAQKLWYFVLLSRIRDAKFLLVKIQFDWKFNALNYITSWHKHSNSFRPKEFVSKSKETSPVFYNLFRGICPWFFKDVLNYSILTALAVTCKHRINPLPLSCDVNKWNWQRTNCNENCFEFSNACYHWITLRFIFQTSYYNIIRGVYVHDHERPAENSSTDHQFCITRSRSSNCSVSNFVVQYQCTCFASFTKKWLNSFQDISVIIIANR